MLFVIKTLLQTVAILIIAYLLPSLVAVDSLMAALAAAFVLGLINTVIRPIFVIFTLPITAVTLGLFLLVINGLLLWLASVLVPGFHVNGFWGAFFGSMLISLVTWVLSSTVGRAD